MNTLGEWQPIETAPKDGTMFLCFVPIKNHRLMLCRITSLGVLLAEDHMPAPWPASHWMPLPQPPKDQQ
jgi:hypothetical protein